VILDRDLAILYQVSTGNLNKAVTRNLDRFPEDFMFQLTEEELVLLQISWLNFCRKPSKGPEGKPDCAASIGGILLCLISLVAFRKAQRGIENKSSEGEKNAPASAKERSMPHDCKQAGFSSGPLK
jgi:ORF6N domain